MALVAFLASGMLLAAKQTQALALQGASAIGVGAHKSNLRQDQHTLAAGLGASAAIAEAGDVRVAGGRVDMAIRTSIAGIGAPVDTGAHWLRLSRQAPVTWREVSKISAVTDTAKLGRSQSSQTR